MKSAWKGGIAIGVLCAVWQVIMANTGWITSPNRMNLFYLVVLIEIAVLIWALTQSAAGNSYGRQVLAGTAMSGIAGVFLFLFSLVLTMVFFPNLINEMKTVQAQILKDAGRTEAEISAALSLQTPLIQALMGAVGTLVTGILASLVIAIFLRKKSAVTTCQNLSHVPIGDRQGQDRPD
jgi:hypothetical protein